MPAADPERPFAVPGDQRLFAKWSGRSEVEPERG